MKDSIKEKRREILAEMNKLQGKCDCRTAEDFVKCKNCKKLQRLGERLSKLVSKRKPLVMGVNSNEQNT